MAAKPILNGKILYKSHLHAPVHDLLSSLDEEIVYSIALTASSKKVLPTDKAEAIDTIMLFTEGIERLFSYKKITSQILTYYLYKNEEAVQGNLSKINLMSKVFDLWKQKYTNSENSVTNTEQTKEPLPSTSPASLPGQVSLVHKVRSDEFSNKFVSWFYSTINTVSSTSDTTILEQMFCENSTADIFIVTPSGEDSSQAEGREACAKSFQQIQLSKGFGFNPNMETGVRAAKSQHGLVRIFCCGSLHQSDTFVGIFEQEFGLCQNPTDKTWQIFVTKLNLKSSVYQVPSLPPGEIFEIEAGS